MLVVFIVLVVLRAAGEIVLDRLNRREILRHKDSVPAAFRERVTLEAYAEGIGYSLDRLRFSQVSTLVSSGFLLFVITTGLLPSVFESVTQWFGTEIWAQALAFFALGWLLAVPDWFLGAWETFGIERRHGFNRSSPLLWLTDQLKVIGLTLLLGLPLLSLVLWFAVTFPQTWWVWGFLLLTGFQLLMLVLAPRVIVPLFNKLSPLPEGPLHERLLALGEKAGFAIDRIQVIDGSRRSRHSNALFTGFGRFRRIILFDTLIEQLEPEQLAAVMAHEIGHSKCGHIPKLLLRSTLTGFCAFAILGWLVNLQPFYAAFGFTYEPGSIVPALFLFSLWMPLVTFWLEPLTNRISRRFEYEADAFARELMGGDPAPLIEALRKLHEENKSNLTPHPLYSGFHYSHPTLIERERALLDGAAG